MAVTMMMTIRIMRALVSMIFMKKKNDDYGDGDAESGDNGFEVMISWLSAGKVVALVGPTVDGQNPA